MFYFKRIDLLLNEKRQLETALRKSAIRHNTSLDFAAAQIDLNSQKLFLNFDGKKDNQYTRLQAATEIMFPKIIISIPKSTEDNCYKFRYGTFSAVLFVLLVLSLLFATATVLIKHSNLLTLLFPGGLLAMYGFLTYLELKLVSNAMGKAVQAAG
jgi:hypothetical protein